ncbi:unnamed protein product, partial [marine sediment metagenome]
MLFGKEEDKVSCPDCGYIITKPYPKDKLCPKCKKFLANMFEKVVKEQERIKPKRREPKQIKKSTKTPDKVLHRKVKVKKKQITKVDLSADQIDIKPGEEYIKLFGISTKNRTPIYCSNDNLIYLLELACNLDYIAGSILGGELDRMMLKSEVSKINEKGLFLVENEVIYIVYGKFPSKKGYWLIDQMRKALNDELGGQNYDDLEKLQKHNIMLRMGASLKFSVEEYIKLQEVFSDKKIPFVDDKITVHYFGMSSQSIGIISLLLDERIPYVFNIPTSDPQEEIELKESVVSAKIEAMAANTLANTQAVPKWIAVKLG